MLSSGWFGAWFLRDRCEQILMVLDYDYDWWWLLKHGISKWLYPISKSWKTATQVNLGTNRAVFPLGNWSFFKVRRMNHAQWFHPYGWLWSWASLKGSATTTKCSSMYPFISPLLSIWVRTWWYQYLQIIPKYLFSISKPSISGYTIDGQLHLLVTGVRFQLRTMWWCPWRNSSCHWAWRFAARRSWRSGKPWML